MRSVLDDQRCLLRPRMLLEIRADQPAVLGPLVQACRWRCGRRRSRRRRIRNPRWPSSDRRRTAVRRSSARTSGRRTPQSVDGRSAARSSVAATAISLAGSDIMSSRAAAIESWRKPAVAVSIRTRIGVPPETGDGEVGGDDGADGSEAARRRAEHEDRDDERQDAAPLGIRASRLRVTSDAEGRTTSTIGGVKPPRRRGPGRPTRPHASARRR